MPAAAYLTEAGSAIRIIRLLLGAAAGWLLSGAVGRLGASRGGGRNVGSSGISRWRYVCTTTGADRSLLPASARLDFAALGTEVIVAKV